MNRWFAKFADRERIDYAALKTAVKQVESGLIDADLGGGLIKQRVAREGGGKSGGYRALILFRQGDRAVFAFAFAKSAKANLNAAELRVFKQAARIVLGLTQTQMDVEVNAGRLFEVIDHDENL